MLRTIIIDDEPSAVEVIRLLLAKKCSNSVEVIGTTTSPYKGIELIENLQPDLVFLDIEMPGMSGIELANYFTHAGFRIVFITAYDSYALHAFKAGAIDYLLKPVNSNELERAIQKVTSTLPQAGSFTSEQLNLLKSLLTKNTTSVSDRIGIGMADKIQFVNTNDIAYCQASGAYTNVVLKEGTKITASKSLGEFEQLLQPLFFRIHHSHLINLNYIKEFQRNDGGYVIMQNNVKLEVSLRRRKDFLQALELIIV